MVLIKLLGFETRSYVLPMAVVRKPLQPCLQALYFGADVRAVLDVLQQSVPVRMRRAQKQSSLFIDEGRVHVIAITGVPVQRAKIGIRIKYRAENHSERGSVPSGKQHQLSVGQLQERSVNANGNELVRVAFVDSEQRDILYRVGCDGTQQGDEIRVGKSSHTRYRTRYGVAVAAPGSLSPAKRCTSLRTTHVQILRFPDYARPLFRAQHTGRVRRLLAEDCQLLSTVGRPARPLAAVRYKSRNLCGLKRREVF